MGGGVYECRRLHSAAYHPQLDILYLSLFGDNLCVRLFIARRPMHWMSRKKRRRKKKKEAMPVDLPRCKHMQVCASRRLSGVVLVAGTRSLQRVSCSLLRHLCFWKDACCIKSCIKIRRFQKGEQFQSLSKHVIGTRPNSRTPCRSAGRFSVDQKSVSYSSKQAQVSDAVCVGATTSAAF